jgi:hypothetical protein
MRLTVPVLVRIVSVRIGAHRGAIAGVLKVLGLLVVRHRFSFKVGVVVESMTEWHVELCRGGDTVPVDRATPSGWLPGTRRKDGHGTLRTPCSAR